MRKPLVVLFMLLLTTGIYQQALACTNFIITKGASADGSVMISYSADSHVLYGALYHWAARDWPAGSMVDVTEWDTGKPMGKIPQVKHTYNVIGNMNEHQLAIGETTYGGREELYTQKGAIIDYGSLIYLSLQRCKTAREAIKNFGELTEKYGYASEGESFSISDANEAWILEMIGKGEGQLGAVWVAMRIPDGYVSGHANQARITTFPLNDPENCLYSKDVIKFARDKGWFDGKDEEFSFSDTYNPVSFSGARACEARVWAMFNRVNSNMGQYQDYAMGHLATGKWGYTTNRMPLWVKPDKKVSVHDMMNLMRDHFEGTKMDMNNDIGAGPFQCPYRWRPMTLKVDGIDYVHERATSTQQTGFVFVAQSRNWLPDPVGGIFWFGLDDTYTTVFSPMYCGMTKVPEAYKDGNGSLIQYSPTSAFWAFNMVANWAYTKYNYMIKDIQPVQQELEEKYIAQTTGEIDKKAADLYKKDKAAGLKVITDYSVKTGQATVKRWQEMFQYLVVKYIDGNVKKEKDGKFETNPYGVPVMPSQPGYPEWWLKEIIREHGDVVKQVGPTTH
ncbi:MAG: C69 family dipeptidase [Bacteroidales bacterium]|nr:C69 family dipeptidase [Bacteroidales bacterium]